MESGKWINVDIGKEWVLMLLSGMLKDGEVDIGERWVLINICSIHI